MVKVWTRYGQGMVENDKKTINIRPILELFAKKERLTVLEI